MCGADTGCVAMNYQSLPGGVWRTACVINEPSGVRGLYRGFATAFEAPIEPFHPWSERASSSWDVFFFVITVKPRVE